jgi:hypothetical protein
MRKMVYKRINNPENGSKSMVLSTRKTDRESTAFIYKSFKYAAQKTQDDNRPLTVPEIHIKKSFDSKRLREKFSFRVKGYFYMTHQRMNFKIDFEHTLRIHLYYRSKDFSPKKSEVLTE